MIIEVIYGTNGINYSDPRDFNLSNKCTRINKSRQFHFQIISWNTRLYPSPNCILQAKNLTSHASPLQNWREVCFRDTSWVNPMVSWSMIPHIIWPLLHQSHCGTLAQACWWERPLIPFPGRAISPNQCVWFNFPCQRSLLFAWAILWYLESLEGRKASPIFEFH